MFKGYSTLKNGLSNGEKEALEMIENNWSWDKRAEEVLEKIVNC